MEQEIDLQKYILAVMKRWHWIMLAALLAGLTAFGASKMQPKTYTATATVLMLVRQTGSEVGVNEPILSVETIDVGARRQGLAALALSETIEAQLPPDVLSRVASPKYQPGMFLLNKQVKLRLQGELLELIATGSTPQQAKDLADAWAATYVDQVGKLYIDEHSSVQLVGNALPPVAPSGPPVTRNTLAAGAAGALVGVIASLLSAILGPSFQLSRPLHKEQSAPQPAPTR